MAKKTKKKKPAKKPSGKKTVKKVAKRPAATKKSAPKKVAPQKKRPAKKAAAKVPGALSVQVTTMLEARLKTLAGKMEKPLSEVLVQALTEFADAWEDHMRTLQALGDGSDRVQLAVPQEPSGG